jgi:diguanylate cyclase (GGDEF)-like protein/PAS domain S-box-containing protein
MRAQAESTPDTEQRHSRVLTALALAAARLLHLRGPGSGVLGTALPPVLARLGQALDVSRIYVLQLVEGRERTHLQRRFEWHDPDAAVADAAAVPTSMDLASGPLARWLREFRRGGCVFGRLADLPRAERAVLEPSGVRAIALHPVLDDGRLWGLLGIDDCRQERIWLKSELDALRALAELLGGAVGRDRAGVELGRREGMFRLLAESTSDMIVLGERGGTMRYVSPAAEAMLGLPAAALEQRDPLELLHPEDARRVRADLSARPGAVAPERTLVHRLRHRAGHWVWVETRLRLVTDVEGRVQRWVASVRDISERRRMEQQLAAEKERALATLRSIADGVIAVNRAGGVDYLNPAAERSCGWTLAEAQERPVTEVFELVLHGDPPPVAAGADALTRWFLACGDGPVPLRARDGTEHMVQLSVAPIHADAAGAQEGGAQGLVLTFRDTSQAAELLRELAYRASHDSLTGLPNREEFERQLDRLVQDAVANGTAHALCYLDLDQFKLVNDSCGHAAGDALLKDVAAALREALDEGDLVARLGGDEFGVLMPHHGAWEAARKAQALLDALARLRFEWSERQFAIGGSIGVAPVTREAGSRAAVLVSADAACYVAKERGRNRVHVLEPSDVELARRQGEMRWVPRLQTALEVGDFHLQAHAIVPTLEGAPTLRHVEVLLALPGASGRLVPPGEFLPAAQRYGLMGRIDRWVVSQVADWLGRREAMGMAELELVAVNLSGSSLSDPEFRDFVEEQVRLLRAPRQLCFEITESEAVANLAEAADFIHRMKEFGCRFALDDFGSGLSSFAYLKRLPVDFVKIDGQFVREMAHDPVNLAMVEAIHRIGKVMGLRTVAEFVETPAIYEAVRRIGVDYCQGFHFGRPVPLSALD